MLGGAPGVAATGRGPAGGGPLRHEPYDHPAAGWGAAKSVAQVIARAREPLDGSRFISKMNQEDWGFDCPGCAWPDGWSDFALDDRGRLTENPLDVAERAIVRHHPGPAIRPGGWARRSGATGPHFFQGTYGQRTWPRR